MTEEERSEILNSEDFLGEQEYEEEQEEDEEEEEQEEKEPEEPEDPQELAEFFESILSELIVRVLPEKTRALTLKKASEGLSLLGKIWNLTECHEGCEIDSIKCQTSDERLLDMEGYVEEYQYLHLEATDMALSDVRIIPEHFIWLVSIDLSGNCLTNISACPISKLSNLVSLKMNRNRIVDPYLMPMKHLQYLGMNLNKIESLHRIYHPNLRTLDVNGNLIKRIDVDDCWKLKKLTQLELRGNRLTTTAGIAYANLQVLYLAENKITEIQGLGCMPNLRRLHLRGNPLSDLSGFSAENPNLEYLNIRSCRVEKVEDLKNLQVLKGLTVLIVKDNVFWPSPEHADEEEHEVEEDVEEDRDLRMKILMMLPQLKRINKNDVTREELLLLQDMEEGDLSEE
ncbi:UNVERIFIED_CONTAM: hypothetical protein PYX00_002706 [Menopon gallinae]|uniref:Leucine-rich repeat-containing protein 23 n=1 Tax=Menopon gallinae TaxID=328185 RepID=A0AAW2HX39_9NEOP